MKLLGLNTDSSESNMDFGHWNKATNVMISYDLKGIVNEKGFELISDNYPSTHTHISSVKIPNKGILIFSTVEDSSEIGLLTFSGAYKKIVGTKALRFSSSYPMRRVVYQINSKNEVLVVFTDAHNPTRLVNIDNLGVEIDNDYNLVDDSKITLFNLFPHFNSPVIELMGVNSGGSLYSGVYYIAVAYIDNNDNVTDWGNISRPINVTAADDSYNDGSLGGILTNKSIDYKVSEIDLRFPKIKVAVIIKQNGKINAYSIGEYQTAVTLNLILTGQEQQTLIANDDILIDRISYDTIGDITVVNKRLYGAILTSNNLESYQKYANNIKVEYILDDYVRWDPSNRYTDPTFVYNKTQFMPEEVYALYIGFDKTDGTSTPWFHIPGRVAKVLTGTKLETELNSNLLTEYPYLSHDVSVNSNSKYFQMRDTSGPTDNPYMGYWENENEYYDDTEDFEVWDSSGKIGSIAGEKVRHHKMPTRAKLFYNPDQISIVGIKVSNIYVPEEMKPFVSRVRVGYAKRTLDNTTILGQSILLFESDGYKMVDVEGEDLDAIEVTSDHLSNNTLNINYNVYTLERNLRRDYIRFKSFDLMLDKPTITPSYIKNLFKLTTNLVTLAKEEEKGYQLRLDLQDTGGAAISEEQRIRKVSDVRYMDHNSVFDSLYKNEYGDEAYVMKIYGGDTISLTVPDVDDTVEAPGTSAVHETFLTNLCNYLRNVFLSYKNQYVVQTGKSTLLDTASTYSIICFGGDAYVGPWSYRGQSDAYDTRYDVDNNDGLYTIVHLYTDMWNNGALRDITTDPLTAYYPAVDAYQLLRPVGEKNMLFDKYRIEYNRDWSSLNDLNIVTISDGEHHATEFSNTIIRSAVQQSESLTIGWRRFAANDSYLVDKKHGKIIGIQALGNSLLIRTERALLRTVDNATLKTTAEDLKLGSADIFSVDPEEVRTSENGIAGSQYYYSAILTDFGFVLIDAVERRIYIVTEALNDITEQDNRELFNESLSIKFNEQMSRLLDKSYLQDNPLIGVGFLVAYDSENKRLLVTKRDYCIKPEYEHKFKGEFVPTQEFINSLVAGDIVLKDGKLVMYKGQ